MLPSLNTHRDAVPMRPDTIRFYLIDKIESGTMGECQYSVGYELTPGSVIPKIFCHSWQHHDWHFLGIHHFFPKLDESRIVAGMGVGYQNAFGLTSGWFEITSAIDL